MKYIYMSLVFFFVVTFELFIISAIVLEVFGLWVPLLILGIFSLLSLIFIAIIHYRHVKYTCPSCNITFKGRRLQSIFSPHVFNKRIMFCPICRDKKWCKETIDEEDLF